MLACYTKLCSCAALSIVFPKEHAMAETGWLVQRIQIFHSNLKGTTIKEPNYTEATISVFLLQLFKQPYLKLTK